MDQEMAKKLLQIGESFCIPGPFFSFEEIKIGNVNKTYKVNYIRDDGSGMAQIKPYLLQKVNTYAFREPTQLMSNIGKVTDYIRSRNPDALCLHFHHTKEKENYVLDSDGFWRMSNYIPSVTFNSCEDVQIVRNAGEAFGRFQMDLSEFNPDGLYYTIPNFHDTRKRYEQLREAVAEDPKGRTAEAKEELDFLFSVEDSACLLTDLLNKGELPLRVTHNDTKINNVLFDLQSKQALAVVDLDTVMPGLVGHDFGDAIRSAANFVEEDSTDYAHAGVNLNIFWAFADGFLAETAKTLTPAEVQTLGHSPFVLACELATRFLADYLLGDPYFHITHPSHNIERVRCQIALAKDMLLKEEAMNAMIYAFVKKYKNC